MSQLVSPFLEEIVEALDGELCKQKKRFAKLPRDLQFYAGLVILQAAGLAKSNGEPGYSELWTPTAEVFPHNIIPPLKQDFASLEIADFDRSISDEVFQSSIKYAKAFGDLLRESQPFIRFLGVGFECYAAGLVTWSRSVDGKLGWSDAQRGLNILELGDKHPEMANEELKAALLAASKKRPGS